MQKKVWIVWLCWLFCRVSCLPCPVRRKVPSPGPGPGPCSGS